MSAAAKFLLEFEARGDQEVVQKIKAVGAAGTEAATELQSLEGMEDPFAPIAEGAESAVAPITDVGTAAGEAVTPLTDLGTAATDSVDPLGEMGTATEGLGSIFSGAGTEADTFSGALGGMNESAQAISGGIDPATTSVEDFGGAASTSGEETMGFGEAAGAVTGTIAGIGGAVGIAVGAFFRYQDAQNKVLKTTTRLQSFNEIYRKGQENLDKILATATTNTDAIAAARDRLAAAETRVAELMRAGITTGNEWQAAQQELQSAQANLAEQVRIGGGDFEKATAQMEKNEIQLGKIVAQENTLAKAQREQNQAILDNVFAYSSLGGQLIQIATGLPKVKTAFGDMGKMLTGGTGGALGLATALGKVAAGAYLVYTAIVTAKAALVLFQALQAQAGGDAEQAAKKFKEGWDLVKNSITPTGGIMSGISEIAKRLGFDIDGAMNKAASGTDKAAASAKYMAVAHGLLAGAGMEANAVIKENAEQTDLQAAALNKLIGPTTTASGELQVMAGEVQKLTEADVASITATENRNRALIIATSGVENARLAEIQYQQALTAMTASLVKDTDEKNANARATLALVDSNENAQNTLATLREEYANSVDKLADLSFTMQKAEAHSIALATAVNETKAALMEERIELEASIKSLRDNEQAQMRLDNAKLEGIKNALEFGDAIEQEKAAFKSEITILGEAADSYLEVGNSASWSMEQIKQFLGVVEQSPEALTALGEAIQGLSDETLGWVEQVKGDKEEVEKVFQDWDLTTKFPEEIRGIMTEGQMEFIKGRAQIERVADTFGPAIASAFEHAATTQDWSQLGQMGPNAAAAIEEGFNGAVPPSLQRIVALLKEPPSGIEEGLPWIQTIITDFENAKQPMISFINTFLQAGGAIGDIAPQLAGTAEGLNTLFSAMEGVAGQGKTLNLTLDQLNKVSIEGVGTFAQVGDNLIPIGTNAEGAAGGLSTLTSKFNPLNTAIQAAGASLTQFQSYLSSFKIEIPPVKTNPLAPMISAALASLDQFASSVQQKMAAVAAAMSKGLGGTKQGTIPTIQINIAPAMQQLASLKNQINAVKQTRIPPIRVNIQPGLQLCRQLTQAINSIRQTRVPRITVNASQAFSTISRVKSQLNSLRNISRTITYRYRTVGSPPRGAQTGMHETLAADTAIMAHKGERVDITPGSGHGAQVAGPLGGSRTINVSVPVFLDGKVITRVVRRHLAEDVTAGM